MLFTLPGRHCCRELLEAVDPVVRFLRQRDIDGLGPCRISYSIRTDDLVSRRNFTRPTPEYESLPDLVADFLDRLKAEGIEEISDLAIITHPLRRGVLQVTEIIFENRRGGRSLSAAGRFSIQFRDHPNAGQVPILQALLGQSVGRA